VSRPAKRFFTHMHPRVLPRAALAWRRTYGLGGLAVLLTIVTGSTGVLLTLYYEPSTGRASESLLRIAYLVPLGWLVRNLHYWAAQILVVVALLHLVRVLAHGALRGRMALNWLVGLGLFVAVVWADFSGYVLRWDLSGREALATAGGLTERAPVVGSAMTRLLWGGDGALLRTYFWHCFGIAAVGALALGYHAWRVRRDGGVALPARRDGASDRTLVPSVQLVRRELIASGVALAALAVVSTYLDAPITLAGQSRAPWFFYPIQLLVARGDPFWLGVVLPLIPLALLAALPWAPAAWWRRGASVDPQARDSRLQVVESAEQMEKRRAGGPA
jgi:quinol-cytochrome oxidoreductase complex cytochrome b subunit